MTERDNDHIRELRGDIMSLVENHNSMSRRIEEIGGTLERKLDSVLHGFPNEDVDGHRRYHQNVIEWQELRNKMVREALVKMAQGSGLAVLGWLAYAIWVAFKSAVTRGA